MIYRRAEDLLFLQKGELESPLFLLNSCALLKIEAQPALEELRTDDELFFSPDCTSPLTTDLQKNTQILTLNL